MIAKVTGSCWFSPGASHIIFSLLAVLAVLFTPLLTAVPVSADWGAEIRLTNAAGNSQNPSVAVYGNNVHVAWYYDRDGNVEIYYKRSTDGGATWGADTRLTNAAGYSFNPSVAVAGNNVHIAWYDNRDGDNEIYYKNSTDGGATWGADTRLTSDAGNSFNPSVAVAGNNVHIAWYDNRDGNFEIYYKRSTDGGTIWVPETRLTTATKNSEYPSITVFGNNVHIAWYDNRDDDWEIYYKRSTDGGATWYADTRLTNDAGDSRNPSVAVYANNVHVAWYDNRDGNVEIYYKRSTDGGITWGADTRLTNAAGNSYYPSITVSGNNVHVAWFDKRDGNNEIYYNCSTDGGTSWGADTRLTSAEGDSYNPSMAVSGNNVHVAWFDKRDGNYEIYYKKNSAPVPTIVSFGPTSGGTGTTVVISGANFTGATAVSFAGIPAGGFTVNSDTQITATVGSGATGKITVTTPSGTGTSATDFTFTSFVSLIGTTRPHGSSMPGLTAALPQSPVILPTVFVKSASLSATRVAPGTAITVTADVVNTGMVNGSSGIKVYVNGELENSRGVTVNSGSNTPITFTVSRSEPGTYTVYVGGANAGSFTVDQFTPDTILIISGALVLFALASGVIYVTRKRQAGY